MCIIYVNKSDTLGPTYPLSASLLSHLPLLPFSYFSQPGVPLASGLVSAHKRVKPFLSTLFEILWIHNVEGTRL